MLLCLFALTAFCCHLAESQNVFSAIESGDTALVRSMLEDNPTLLDAPNEDSMTPLLFAISSRQPEAASQLLDRGADHTVARDNGLTALHYAALRGYPDLIERLVSLGIDVNVQTNASSTPLLHASGNSEFAATRKLLELGADTELPNSYGRTPLLNVARESGDVEMAQLLVEHGADVDAIDTFGDSPIVLAAWRGYAEIVDLLLDNNVDVPVDGRRGTQLIQYSAEKGLDRLMARLVEGGADLTLGSGHGASLVHAAALGGSGAIVGLLLEQGLDAATPDMFGWTPLHYAAVKGRAAVTEILAGMGVALEARTLSGHSAMSLAVDQGHHEVVNLLVGIGADASTRLFPELTGPYLGQAPPAETPELFAPDIVEVNWGGHSSVTFSPDGTEAYWTNYVVPSDAGYGHSRIVGSRIENGRWATPVEPVWASSWEDGGDVPIFSADGSSLYFLSTRPLTRGGEPSDENIWIVDKTANGWGDPYPAPGEINSLPMHWQFTLSNSATIYVQGNGPDELGRGDIYRSTLVDGVYTTPVNLGDVINTPGSETSPYISPDESFLLFASSGHEGASGSLGIFISWNDGVGGWTEPVFTGLVGLCPLITPDGEYLFFRGMGDHGGLRWLPAAFLDNLRPAGI